MIEMLPIQDLVFADRRADLDEAPYAPAIAESPLLDVLAPYGSPEFLIPPSVELLQSDGEFELLDGAVVVIVIAHTRRLRALILQPRQPSPGNWTALVNDLRSYADRVGARLAAESNFGG